jgi:hypothetical protein
MPFSRFLQPDCFYSEFASNTFPPQYIVARGNNKPVSCVGQAFCQEYFMPLVVVQDVRKYHHAAFALYTADLVVFAVYATTFVVAGTTTTAILATCGRTAWIF